MFVVDSPCNKLYKLGRTAKDTGVDVGVGGNVSDGVHVLGKGIEN